MGGGANSGGSDHSKLCNFCPFLLKVGFLQKVMAKFSNLSNRHACEPKIVPEHLFPVSVINKSQVTFWIHLTKKPAYYELWYKNLIEII